MAIHVVSSGESLWAISNEYEVPVTTIVRDNGIIAAQFILPGLALYIPNNRPVPFQRYYQVKAGDVLWSLAQRFRTSVEQILQANPGMDPNRLRIGQNLVIPSPVPLPLTTLGFIEPYNPEAFLSAFNSLAKAINLYSCGGFFSYRRRICLCFIKRSGNCCKK